MEWNARNHIFLARSLLNKWQDFKAKRQYI